MSTSDDAPLELPCCEAGKESAPDPCPWHPGEIKLPAAGPTEETSKEIVDRVFREMGIEPGTREYRESSVEEWDIKPGHVYHPPEKSVPYLGDRMVVPWGVIIFFMLLAVSCAFLIGWSLSELDLI